MKYLDKKPFSSKPATKDYRDGWARTFTPKRKTMSSLRAAVRKAQKAGGGLVYGPPGLYREDEPGMSGLTLSEAVGITGAKPKKRERAK